MDSQLPAELYRSVLCHVTHAPTLLSLMLSSQLLSYEAERVLYSSIDRTKSKTQVKCMRRLLASPRVAALVHSFDVALADSSEPDFWSLVSQTLLILPNLSSLRMFDLDSPKPVLVPECPFKLKSLVYWGANRDITPFLTTQCELEELVFHSPDSSSFELPENALPKLTRIHSDASTISALLPGRSNLSFIRWSIPCASGQHDNSEHEEEEESATGFGIGSNFPLDSLKGLKVLCFQADSGRFASIAKYLESVESLEIHDPKESDLDALKSLPHIRRLIINNISPGLHLSPPHHLFGAVPSLRCVYLEQSGGRPGLYERWKKLSTSAGGAEAQLERNMMKKPKSKHWAEMMTAPFEEDVMV